MNPFRVGMKEEGKESTTSFFVGTQANCLLCLSRIPSESELATETPPQSLQYLYRYLKLDLTKVLNGTDVPSEVLDMLERLELKARLCGECASLNDKFSELYGQLEKIRMEVDNCLGGIRGKLIQAVESGALEEMKGRMMTGNLLDQLMTLQVGEALRNQAIQKCSEKLGPFQPLVLVKQGILDEDNADQFKDPPPEESSTPTEDSPGPGPTDFTPEVFKPEPILIPPPPQPQPGRGRGLQTPSHYTLDATGRCTCKICMKVYRNRSCWLIHYRSLHQKVRYRCTECGKDFSQDSSRQRHFALVHLGRRFQCQTCSKTFKYGTSLGVHYLTSPTCRDREGRSNLTSTESSTSPTSANRSLLPLGEPQLQPATRRLGSPLFSFLHSSRKYKCELCEGDFMDLYAWMSHYKAVHQKNA